MELIEGIRTTGAARGFTDQPVDDATLHQILDDARFAPSGGNRQGWRVAVVKDVAIRRRIGELTQPVLDEYYALTQQGRGAPYNPLERSWTVADPPHVDSPLVQNAETMPVVLAIAVDLRAIAVMDGELGRPPVTAGASLYPFCWNVLLAARAHGLGGVMTTFLTRAEPQAGPLLGLPAGHALAATIYLGYPVHQPTKLRRNPVEHFATVDRFDGEPFTA